MPLLQQSEIQHIIVGWERNGNCDNFFLCKYGIFSFYWTMGITQPGWGWSDESIQMEGVYRILYHNEYSLQSSDILFCKKNSA